MKFKTEKLGESLAEGSEKIIYHHPHDPEKVIAETREKGDEYSADQAKGRFYLTKILHLLFPRNIPDASFSRGGLNQKMQMVIEKKHLGSAHNILRDRVSPLVSKFINDGKMDADEWAPVIDKESEMSEELDATPAFQVFTKNMKNLGLLFDEAPRNFGYDGEGNLVYVDNNFLPWQIGGNEIYPMKYDKLHEMIQALNDGDRERAMVYFNRLNMLYNKAVTQMAKKKSIKGKRADKE